MLIINGKIFTMEEKPIDNGFVRIKKNLIEETGEMSALKNTENEKILDVHGAWVMPGLIESHAHIGSKNCLPMLTTAKLTKHCTIR